jgi:hypothetical protein
MEPSGELLHRATNGDDPYMASLLKLMAVQLSYTTLKVLEGVKQLGEKIDKTQEKALSKLEENRNTSTTKKQKGQCAGCGAKEGTEKKMMKCSRCEIVRYCSVVCQKKDWPVHKKVCAPVSKWSLSCANCVFQWAFGWRHVADRFRRPRPGQRCSSPRWDPQWGSAVSVDVGGLFSP